MAISSGSDAGLKKYEGPREKPDGEASDSSRDQEHDDTEQNALGDIESILAGVPSP